MVSCAVSGCRNSSVKCRLRFFRFPSDNHRRSQWIAFTKRQNFLPKYSKICEAHFDLSQFELRRKDGWKKLKWTAVPTLYPTTGSCHLTNKPRSSYQLLSESQHSLSAEMFDENEKSKSCSSGHIQREAKHHREQEKLDADVLSSKMTKSQTVIDGEEILTTDKRVLRSLLVSVTENIQKFSQRLRETSKRKTELVQIMNELTQKEIMLQRKLKKELDKEIGLQQQLEELEELVKEDWMKTDGKIDQLSSVGLDALFEKENQHHFETTDVGKTNEQGENSDKEISECSRKAPKFSGNLAALSNLEVEFSYLPMENGEHIDKTDENDHATEDTCEVTFSCDKQQYSDVSALAGTLAEGENGDGDDCDLTLSNCKASSEIDSAVSQSPPSQRKHVCSFCGERFWNAGARQSHELTHGNEFRCDVCGKVFSYRAGLMNHKKTHSDERPFACTLCDRRLKTNGTLKRHMRSHTREKHYTCSICLETFFYAHQRQVHMAVHTGETAYECRECRRGFSSSNCLSRHILIHRGEKPFECDVCGKMFRQRNQVKAHKEMHGEKPYVCSRCGKRLGYGSFWKHMREHNGTKTLMFYQCAVCDKKLTTKKTLEMHTRMIHMGEAPYVCSVCYQEFGKYRDYRAHRKEEHCNSLSKT